MTGGDVHSATKDTERGRRPLVSGSVGDLIEWYEFGVYGYFATITAARFFTPAGGGEAGALVTTYASFALAFFFRPVGAALFGRLGDRVGRRPVLVLLIVLMTVATTLTGVPRAARRPTRLLLEQPVPTPLMPLSPTPHTVGA